MVTFVDCGEMHGKETRGLSAIPIISSGSALILIIDRVCPEQERMRRESGYAGGRPARYLLHARVAWAFEQPRKTVNGTSVS